MNDLMSLGVHRLWKRFTLSQTGLKAGQRVLDLAGGTGDLAMRMAKMVGQAGDRSRTTNHSRRSTIGQKTYVLLI